LIESRCPFVKVRAFNENFDEFIKRELDYDLIIDCTDNLKSREKIDEFSKQLGVPWIYASVEEFNGQVCFFDKSSFKAFKITDKKPTGVAAPIVMMVASFEANLAIRYLAGLSVKKDFLYYLYFDSDGEFVVNKFHMPM